MAKAINLLTSDFEEPKSYRFISKTSIIFLVGYITLLIIVFGVSFFLNTQKNNRVTEVNQLISSVQQKKDIEELIVTIKNRTSVAQTIYAKGAPSPSELVNNIISLLPSSVSLLNLTVNNDGEIIVIVTSKNSAGIIEYLDKVRNAKLTSVVMNTIALNTDGYYIVSLEIKP
jgi:hypothetical protein